ncbi:mercury methylation ferredoxin HgcB [Oceanidesulfovibrio marinus]|uniref:4Fe-4S dicluster domain-containing protein n=1 Tax=Oceanidesulfovibrio marinus TaxID=370038 RepID=A0ABX6NC31_9BACT|nr:mercury methylation ferredoxin HgcB [Oceanidesulfovibrio marinus]QJT07911.1 4Fe-4S dicluster domain-containing protein [Oceanidesulfovibrio marinus]
MKNFRHYSGVATLKLDRDACVGCGLCPQLCPHGVLAMDGKRARIVDPDGCMECGACAKNCPSGALSVSPGVGCASYIINKWLRGSKAAQAKNCC